MRGEWIDISMPIKHGMEHWPSDPDVVVERFEDRARGADYNTTRIAMSAHTGTHVDAPLHCADGASMDALSPEKLIGPVRVIALADADECSIRRGERVLIKTGQRDGELKLDMAARFAAASSACVGIDSISIGTLAVHRMLLENGVWVIEGLNLQAVEPGTYEMVCLPLRIAGSDGAPARALLRRLA